MVEGGCKRKSMEGKERKARLPKLGVIRLDEYIYPPAKGDIDHPESFTYKVDYEVVKGLTFDVCKAGTLDEDTKKNFVDAIKHLVEKKHCKAITGDCGFMMWLQELARDATHVPVFMSSLVLLPSVTQAMGLHEVIILTANEEKLQPMMDLLKAECGLDVQENPNFHIVGCGGVPGFEAVEEGTAVDVEKVTPGIVKLAKDSLAKYPKARAFLLECTELPAYSDSIRCETGLPVFDAISCAEFYLGAYRDNPRFGLDDWQHKGRRIKRKTWTDEQVQKKIA